MGRNVVRQQSLLNQTQKRRLSGYLVYTDGWLWFGHVYVILRTSNSWVKINQNLAYTQIDVVPLGWLKDIEGECIPFTVDVPYNQKRYGFGFFSCVEQVKSVLGIKAWRVMTPKQLKRYMKCQKVYTRIYTRKERELQQEAARRCENPVRKVLRLLKHSSKQLRLLRNRQW